MGVEKLDQRSQAERTDQGAQPQQPAQQATASQRICVRRARNMRNQEYMNPAYRVDIHEAVAQFRPETSLAWRAPAAARLQFTVPGKFKDYMTKLPETDPACFAAIQGGDFRLTIDGDLFKVTLTLPRAEQEEKQE